MSFCLKMNDGPLSPSHTGIIQKIVAWYKVNHEVFPWRTPSHGWQQHYRVWVSEIMLQQTTVQSVIPYFEKFMTRFPDVQMLAHASIDEVLTYWQGLGYYRRAHHLHKAATMITENHDAVFPKTYEMLRLLPGVGEYTAAAISAIASHQPCVPVDGNVIRVFSRVFEYCEEPKTVLPMIKGDVKIFQESFRHAGYTFPTQSIESDTQFMPSFFAQGLMDLGRTVCTPKNPSCSFCPIKTECKAYEKGVQHQIPMAAKKAIVPVKYAKCWVPLQSNHVFLEKRTQKGLLSGLWQVPITDFMHDTQSLPQEGATIGTITHVFSHFKLWVDIEMVDHNPALGAQQKEGVWVKKQDLHMYALSTLMKKILKKAGIL